MTTADKYLETAVMSLALRPPFTSTFSNTQKQLYWRPDIWCMSYIPHLFDFILHILESSAYKKDLQVELCISSEMLSDCTLLSTLYSCLAAEVQLSCMLLKDDFTVLFNASEAY